MAGLSTGGGSFAPDMGSSATSGDVYSTTNATQGGLTINKGLSLPPWTVGFSVGAIVVIGGIWVWKKK
jgi:hypothetical protein